MAEQTPAGNLPAKREPLSLIVGSQKLTIDPEAKSLLLTRTSKGYVIEEKTEFGNNDVFIRRDNNGVVRLAYKTVKLSAANKEIAKIGDNYIITVPGYNKLNQIAGISPLTPPSLFVEGKEQSNPYVMYEKGQIKRVIARKIAIGYSPVGNLVAIDTVRHYNFDAYYLQDLQAKAKYNKGAKFGTVFSCAFDATAQLLEKNEVTYAKAADGKIYVFKPVKDVEGIWIDPSHAEIIEVYSQHIRHQIFGETIAQNIAWRNALKAHPAIATSQVTMKDGYAEVLVYGYRHELDRNKLQEMEDTVKKGEQIAGALMQESNEEAQYEEVAAEIEAVADETVEEKSPPPQEQPDTFFFDIEKVKADATAKGLNAEKLAKDMFQTRLEILTLDQKKRLLTLIATTSSGSKKDDKKGEQKK